MNTSSFLPELNITCFVFFPPGTTSKILPCPFAFTLNLGLGQLSED